jgi:CMP/dCMP kinase
VEQSEAFPVIAIDGGAGTGKTTSAARVAERLGFCYVDSGAVYRAIALALRESGFAAEETTPNQAVIASLPLRIQPEEQRFRVFLGDRELDQEIRTPEISRLASKLAVLPQVRRRVGTLLREARARGPLVVEGRDIGTVVFPDADLKIFLEADLEVRANRRRRDLLGAGRDLSHEEVARDLSERDERDSTRSDAPLRRAEGAVLINTGGLSIDEQVQQILDAFARVRPER